jgi:predicted RNase H-like HicB family nuclease/DNA-binding CsgD family transcriptional regulator
MDQPKYRIEIFWSDEDGGYIANVPDLRYCSAFGETYEEALREVLVAMELHLDTLQELGREIPEPVPPRTEADFAVEPGRAFGDEPARAINRLQGAQAERFIAQVENVASEVAIRGIESAAEVAEEGATSGIDLAVLTRRQREVLERAAQGLNNAQIARELHMPVSTVNRHMRAAVKALSAAHAVDKTILDALRR